MALARDIVSAWQAIDNGVVDQATRTRQKYWNHWVDYTSEFQQDPILEHLSELQQLVILTAFAARVRTGHYGRGSQVRVSTVSEALSAVAKTLQLAGKPSPIHEAEGIYKIPVARLVEGYRRQDPPSVPQLAVPVSVPEEMYRQGYNTKCPTRRATGDLGLIAFYYLLRVGEYTKPRYSTRNGTRKRATRTVQFRVSDIGFFREGKILARNCPLKILLSATSCTLKITNQKNGRMGQTIHHHAIPHQTCPVKALARRVHHILSNNGASSNLICDVWDKTSSSWTQITNRHISQGLRHAVKALQLHRNGIDADLVGPHSLRAGGAMALKLTGADDTTIMKMGRWSGLTFLQYIHNQIAHISKGLSSKMNTRLDFINIAAIEQP
jgi:hypothetical protein